MSQPHSNTRPCTQQCNTARVSWQACCAPQAAYAADAQHVPSSAAGVIQHHAVSNDARQLSWYTLQDASTPTCASCSTLGAYSVSPPSSARGPTALTRSNLPPLYCPSQYCAGQAPTDALNSQVLVGQLLLLLLAPGTWVIPGGLAAAGWAWVLLCVVLACSAHAERRDASAGCRHTSCTACSWCLDTLQQTTQHTTMHACTAQWCRMQLHGLPKASCMSRCSSLANHGWNRA